MAESATGFRRLADLLAGDLGDPLAGNLVAAKLPAETTAERIITFATASWPSTSAAGPRRPVPRSAC